MRSTCSPPRLGRMPAANPDLSRVRLHVVTGKGGTGKTTVAAALALALARQRPAGAARRGRGAAGHLADLRRPPIGHTETRILPGPRRRRGVGHLGRRQGLAARVPPEVLQGRPGDWRAGAVRRGRLRDDHRARRARRAAHRQGLRGGRAAHRSRSRRRPRRTTPSSSTPRPPAAWCGSSTSTPRSPTSRKVGPIRSQADSITRMLRSHTTAVHVVTLLEEMPVQETVDALADLRRGRPAAGRDRRQPAAGARCCRPRCSPSVRSRGPPRWPRASRRDLARRRPDGSPTASSRGWSPTRATTPTGWPWSTSRTRSSPSRAGSPCGCRCSPRAPRAGASRCWRTRSTQQGMVVDAAAAPLDLRSTLLRPTASTRIVVCCGSGGVGKTTTAAALGLWAAEHGRRVVVLTIDPARRLAQSLGLTELDNTPRPVAGVGTDSGGSPRRDDARHEAHLRRGGGAARHPREGRPDPRQPLLPGGLELVRRDAGVHGDGEAGPAPGRGRPRRPLGPHRRRHPAVPLGPRLPRRPQAARLVPRRPVHPAAGGARQGRGPGRPQGVQRRGRRS